MAPLEQEVALIQRDATCPWRPTDTINLQWYVARLGNIADGNRVLGTASYLIHWPTSDARLVLIKWLGEIWLRKAAMPSDSRRNSWTLCVLLTLEKLRLCDMENTNLYLSVKQYTGIRINYIGGSGTCLCAHSWTLRMMFSISVKYSSSFSFLVNGKTKPQCQAPVMVCIQKYSTTDDTPVQHSVLSTHTGSIIHLLAFI